MRFKNVAASFNAMHPSAYRFLVFCLSMILASLFLFCLYLEKANASVLFSMWVQRVYISETVLSAVLISFGGAFLLDVAHKRDAR